MGLGVTQQELNAAVDLAFWWSVLGVVIGISICDFVRWLLKLLLSDEWVNPFWRKPKRCPVHERYLMAKAFTSPEFHESLARLVCLRLRYGYTR